LIVESFKSSATSVGLQTFSPADYLLGIVQHAVALQVDQRVILPGKGEVVILPKRGLYYAKVHEVAEFCSVPATELNVTGFHGTELHYFSRGMSIKSLLWKSAFYASKGRILENLSICDFVKLRHWPNLTRLPVTPNTARICAILTRYRTVIVSVPHVLGVTSQEVCQIYSAAYCAGIVDVINLRPEEANLKAATNIPRTESKQKNNLLQSLFIKISGL
jgi:hypothetical protein